jgi:hypothetical protein
MESSGGKGRLTLARKDSRFDGSKTEAGPELLTAIIEASALDAPTMADVLRIARERGGDDAADERSLMADLASASVRSPGGYALGVERNAREIMKAATRRRTIDAAALVADVAADP